MVPTARPDALWFAVLGKRVDESRHDATLQAVLRKTVITVLRVPDVGRTADHRRVRKSNVRPSLRLVGVEGLEPPTPAM